LSAAQVGIAVEGATDAAKNAADLILTEPGLSPIYGAVLESRRIFSRIKSYVIYRVAASAILVLVLSVVIFATGCAVNSLLVIILALLNDISMIPVAYDNAKATCYPQLPDAAKLVLMSLYYAIMHTGAGLAFIFVLNNADFLEHPIDLQLCANATQGFVWLHLVLVTEFAIFSVRAPRFFWESMPSWYLIGSVLLTCAIGTIVAMLPMGLEGEEVIFIWVFNLIIFALIDLGKVAFRKVIKDVTGGVIESDELVHVEKPKSETVKKVEKSLRNIAHRSMSRPSTSLSHSIVITDLPSSTLEKVVTSFMSLRHSFSDGFIPQKRMGRRGYISSEFSGVPGAPSGHMSLP